MFIQPNIEALNSVLSSFAGHPIVVRPRPGLTSFETFLVQALGGGWTGLEQQFLAESVQPDVNGSVSNSGLPGEKSQNADSAPLDKRSERVFLLGSAALVRTGRSDMPVPGADGPRPSTGLRAFSSGGESACEAGTRSRKALSLIHAAVPVDALPAQLADLSLTKMAHVVADWPSEDAASLNTPDGVDVSAFAEETRSPAGSRPGHCASGTCRTRATPFEGLVPVGTNMVESQREQPTGRNVPFREMRLSGVWTEQSGGTAVSAESLGGVEAETVLRTWQSRDVRESSLGVGIRLEPRLSWSGPAAADPAQGARVWVVSVSKSPDFRAQSIRDEVSPVESRTPSNSAPNAPASMANVPTSSMPRAGISVMVSSADGGVRHSTRLTKSAPTGLAGSTGSIPASIPFPSAEKPSVGATDSDNSTEKVTDRPIAVDAAAQGLSDAPVSARSGNANRLEISPFAFKQNQATRGKWETAGDGAGEPPLAVPVDAGLTTVEAREAEDFRFSSEPDGDKRGRPLLYGRANTGTVLAPESAKESSLRPTDVLEAQDVPDSGPKEQTATHRDVGAGIVTGAKGVADLPSVGASPGEVWGIRYGLALEALNAVFAAGDASTTHTAERQVRSGEAESSAKGVRSSGPAAEPRVGLSGTFWRDPGSGAQPSGELAENIAFSGEVATLRDGGGNNGTFGVADVRDHDGTGLSTETLHQATQFARLLEQTGAEMFALRSVRVAVRGNSFFGPDASNTTVAPGQHATTKDAGNRSVDSDTGAGDAGKDVAKGAKAVVMSQGVQGRSEAQAEGEGSAELVSQLERETLRSGKPPAGRANPEVHAHLSGRTTSRGTTDAETLSQPLRAASDTRVTGSGSRHSESSGMGPVQEHQVRADAVQRKRSEQGQERTSKRAFGAGAKRSSRVRVSGALEQAQLGLSVQQSQVEMRTGGTRATRTLLAPARPAASAPADSIFRQLRAQIYSRPLTAEGAHLVVQLKPPELGRIRIRVETHGHVVRAIVESDSASTRELLNNNLSQLVQTLDEKGLRVHQVQVMPFAERAGGFDQGPHPNDRRAAPDWSGGDPGRETPDREEAGDSREGSRDGWLA